MTAALRVAGPLRLPIESAETASSLPEGGPRARLEELGLRRFVGGIELRAADWLAEVLLREGEPLAAALGGPGLETPLVGQQALAALLDQATEGWSCRLIPLEPAVVAALAGLGGTGDTIALRGVDDLRDFLRARAAGRQSGVLELSFAERWARVLIADGQLLGSQTDAAPELTGSLAQLGELLTEPRTRTRWFPATAGPGLPIPRAPSMEGAAAEVERQVCWIVSRFEGAWSRAREVGGLPDQLEAALAQMLQLLLTLAGELEAAHGDSPALDAALARLAEVEAEVPARDLAALDPRLQGMDDPRQACPILSELVAGALARIVRACPDHNLAECCRQAALALEAELRVALPPGADKGADSR